jgi:hypothetical protein
MAQKKNFIAPEMRKNLEKAADTVFMLKHRLRCGILKAMVLRLNQGHM